MMRTVVCRDGARIVYLEQVENGASEELQRVCADADAVVLSAVGPLAGTDREGLLRTGFVQVDRSLLMTCRISSESVMMRGGDRYCCRLSDRWEPAEIYKIARHYFDGDPRFSLWEGRNEERKDELLSAYLQYLRENAWTATLLYEKDELIGFNLWRIGDAGGRIYLGGVRPEKKGIGAGVLLYSHTAGEMRKRGCSTLAEWISTANLPSLNLHVKLFAGKYRYAGYTDTWHWIR